MSGFTREHEPGVVPANLIISGEPTREEAERYHTQWPVLQCNPVQANLPACGLFYRGTQDDRGGNPCPQCTTVVQDQQGKRRQIFGITVVCAVEQLYPHLADAQAVEALTS